MMNDDFPSGESASIVIFKNLSTLPAVAGKGTKKFFFFELILSAKRLLTFCFPFLF
jgi:hypothetical protein